MIINLSPYEKNRIVEDNFGKTEMGRDLLAQDYLLKQITEEANLISKLNCEEKDDSNGESSSDDDVQITMNVKKEA